MKWEKIDSKYLVDDRWLKLRSDTFKTEKGTTISPYYIIENKTWVNCIVFEEDSILLVEQYRPGVNEVVIEIIGGGVETEDLDPASAIQREIREELGYTGGKIVQTGISYANPANQTNTVHSFIAYGGKISQDQNLEGGESLTVKKVSFQEFARMIENESNIMQSLHLASIFFALRKIKDLDDESLQRFEEIVLG